MAADPQMPITSKSTLKKRSSKQHTSKHNGATYELAFMVECMKRGWHVSVPVGEDSRYDVIVDTPSGLHRVQIKTCNHSRGGSFRLRIAYGCRKKKSYTTKECDFIGAFVVPLNTWWIIPVDKIMGGTINVSRSYHIYNSAWHLLSTTPRNKNKR